MSCLYYLTGDILAMPGFDHSIRSTLKCIFWLYSTLSFLVLYMHLWTKAKSEVVISTQLNHGSRAACEVPTFPPIAPPFPLLNKGCGVVSTERACFLVIMQPYQLLAPQPPQWPEISTQPLPLQYLHQVFGGILRDSSVQSHPHAHTCFCYEGRS
jgi:hypothetical protein